MAKRWTSLRRSGGCKKGDKVKILGGTACIGMEGIAQEDGSGSHRVQIKFGDGGIIGIKAERLIVLELGPEGPSRTSTYPHPQGHNFLAAKMERNTTPRSATPQPHPKGEPAPQPITKCCIRCEGTGMIIHTHSGAPMPCPKCGGKVTEVEGIKEEQGNKMAQKQAARKKNSDWNFD